MMQAAPQMVQAAPQVMQGQPQMVQMQPQMMQMQPQMVQAQPQVQAPLAQPMAVFPQPTQVYGQHAAAQVQPQYIAAPAHLPQLNQQESQPGQLVMAPTKWERVYVEAPVPRLPGGRDLHYMPPMEMNVTRGPTG